MEYQKYGSKYVMRLDKGDEIVESISRFCQENNIRLGTVLGIGAVNKVVIGLFETASKKYHSRELTGDMEITSLVGNISTQEEEVYLHLHITLADGSLGAVGGHLNKAVISATGEIIIDTLEGRLDRKFCEEVGLNLLEF